MILVVGLALAAILQIVIPLGSTQAQNWPLIVGLAGVCLVVGGLYLYFWIVVLELFIKMAPAIYQLNGEILTQPSSLTFHQVILKKLSYEFNKHFCHSSEFSANNSSKFSNLSYCDSTNLSGGKV